MSEGQHGGYRRPTNPAPVSGPGRLSRRTDGRQPTQDLPNAKYGENAAFRQAQMAAPMNGDIGSGGMAAGAAPAPGPDLSQIVPLDAPTQRPDQPITAGMSGGPGAGPAVPNRPSPLTPEQAERLRAYLPVLITLASRDDADPNTRQLVRQLRAELG
jgi:hypothetical protein